MDYVLIWGAGIGTISYSNKKSTLLSVFPNPLSQGQKFSYFPVTRTRELPSQDVSISANADTMVRSFIVSITLTDKYLFCNNCSTFQKI